MGEIVLYGPTAAPFTEKVRRGLLLKKLDFELVEPTCPEDYRRWSPETGLLPVLDIDGERVADSTRILLRLDELYPEPPLLSGDSVVATQQRQLEDWADESFLFYFQRWLRMSREQALDALAGEREQRHPLVRTARHVAAWLAAGGTWERRETALLRGLGDRMSDLVNFLGTRPFFYADRPSMADLAVYGMLYTTRNDAIQGSRQLLAERPTLVSFMARVENETGGV